MTYCAHWGIIIIILSIISHCNCFPRPHQACSKQVLKHPLVRALLRKKWQTTRYFVFSFLAFYVTFVTFISFYLMLSLPPTEV